MPDSPLGLEGLANQLQTNVQMVNDPKRLPTALYAAISGWLADKIFPLIIGVSILATLLFTFYGAFLYFTAYGDENRATQAKKSITFAIVGFVITLLAFSISAYVQNVIISKDAQGVITAPKEWQAPTKAQP